MTNEEAREVAQAHLANVDKTDANAVLGAVNRALTELAGVYNYRVLCPVSGKPLVGVGIGQDGMLVYAVQ